MLGDKLKDAASSFRYSDIGQIKISFWLPANLFITRISILSSHLNTSNASSVSALNTVILDIRAAAASWSKPASNGWFP